MTREIIFGKILQLLRSQGGTPMDPYGRMTPETLTQNYRWSLFENTLRDPDPATSLIIFQDNQYYAAFMEAWQRLPVHNHEGTLIDLTPFGEFTADSHMWGNGMNERLATSRTLGTKFVCLMADQESSYREYVLPHRPETQLRLVFSGAFPREPEGDPRGSRVKVVCLNPPDGMMEIYTNHLDARRVGVTGKVINWIPGLSRRDIWEIQDENGQISAYRVDELEPIEELESVKEE